MFSLFLCLCGSVLASLPLTEEVVGSNVIFYNNKNKFGRNSGEFNEGNFDKISNTLLQCAKLVTTAMPTLMPV